MKTIRIETLDEVQNEFQTSREVDERISIVAVVEWVELQRGVVQINKKHT